MVWSHGHLSPGTYLETK
ncbi:hypothetical protein F383_31846 [Gossypium arboreum]|uniref:Uncharacterized protein n=1 Tax=Gossypium arboreum TaxID=29729 RepID=A0A0B0PM87_GOSAR|nr:hypothetical protein F383_31846 [Gossypium arboreum]